MQYINPYDLLNISSTDISEFNSVRIRKAKAALFLQIDLNFSEDSPIGEIDYKGISLTKADCIKIIDDLDNPEKKEFHFFIHVNRALDNFLTTRDLAFFIDFKTESIYNLHEFIDFISPYFSEQYNTVLTKYFTAGNLELSSKILAVKPLVNNYYHDKCFAGVRTLLNDIIENLRSARDKIDEDNALSRSDLFDRKFEVIKQINTRMINLLPFEDFQNIRNHLADRIQAFAVIVYNIEIDLPDQNKKNLSNSLKIIEVAKRIDCEGLEEIRTRDNYFIIKKNVEIYEERIKREKENPNFKKCSLLINAINVKIQQIEDKTTNPQDLRQWFIANLSTDNIAFLNNLDDSFIGIRNDIALQLKSLSISVWNRHDNIQVALMTLSKGLSIKTDKETRVNLVAANTRLEDLKRQIDLRDQTRTKLQNIRQNIPVGASKSDEKGGAGIIAGILILGIIIYIITNSNNSSNSSSNISTGSSSGQTIIPDPSVSKAVDSAATVMDSSVTRAVDSPMSKVVPAYTPPPIPVYSKVFVSNGNLVGCRGLEEKFDQSLGTKIIITAQNTDAAVKLIEYETNKCIRFVFINDGTTYTVRHIPEGKYYLKIAYGNDWSVLEGHGECSGHFTSHALYKKDDNIYDFNRTYNLNGDPETPYYTLKLYTTFTTENSYNNSSANSISEDDFNN